MTIFAALFPGQGSQTVGMLADFASRHPEVIDTFSEASEALGYDLWALSQDGPVEKLSLTEITQPLLLTAGIALFRLWIARGGAMPAYMAGHSLGEYTALSAAQSLKFVDAVRVVRARGQFMQEAVPQGVGAMAAVIGLADDLIESVCAETARDMQRVITAVNYNAPGQLVIAGHADAIEKSLPKLKEAGAKRAVMLPVSAPFHCALMKSAAENLAEVLSAVDIATPVVPVIQNISMEPETNTGIIQRQLVTQTFSPVRWTKILTRLTKLKVIGAAEFGPGSVLCGLAKRNQTHMAHFPLGTLDQFNAALNIGANA